MKRLMKKFEDIMVAITFAEVGEFDSAEEMLGQQGLPAFGGEQDESQTGEPVIETV